jgi:hypothetical protein
VKSLKRFILINLLLKNEKLYSPDWEEQPFLVMLALARGTKKDVEGKRENGNHKSPSFSLQKKAGILFEIYTKVNN